MPTYNPYTESSAIEKYQFLHHFLPHPETKTRAKLLSHTALLGYSLVMLVVIGLFQVLPQIAPGVLGYASSINISSLFDGTNDLREDSGLQRLNINSALSIAAQKKAEHMFEEDYWAHISPDGTAPWDFILGEDYDYTFAGENLAKNFNSSDQVVEAWFKSPSHRENLLNENYEEIGFAVVNGVLEGYETTLVVQMFGKPRTSAQIATLPEESAVATEEIVVEEVVPEVVVVPVPIIAEEVAVLPAIDIATASKSITFLIGGFLITLLLLDIWYSKKKGIPKVTGPAFAHVLMLVFTLVGVWFALSPGKIL